MNTNGPGSAATPTGAYIETLGETMQVESTRLYRVKTVAAMLDVSAATIYRAIDSGALPALKLGMGSGTLRVSESALAQYVESCAEAAAAGWLEAAARVRAAEHEGGAA